MGMRRWTISLAVVLASTLSACAPAPAATSTGSPSESTRPPSLTPSPSPPPIEIPPIPGGTYEVDVTRADAKKFGVTDCDPEEIAENTGHIELTLENGRFRWFIDADHPIFHHLFTGVYSGSDQKVVLTFDPNTADEGVNTLRWTFHDDQLRFKVLDAQPGGDGVHLCMARMQYEAHPWRKTG